MNDNFMDLMYVKINGYSMQPLLYSNDTAVVKKTNKYVVGDIIVFKYSSDNYIVHRLVGYEDNENGMYFCKGDNSFQIEEIVKLQIFGKVIFLKKGDQLITLPSVSKKFILLSLSVNYEFLRNKQNIKETIKSKIYKEYIEERNLVCKI